MNFDMTKLTTELEQRQRKIDENVAALNKIIKLERLNDKEKDFINSVMTRLKTDKPLSQKMHNWLVKIVQKCQ